MSSKNEEGRLVTRRDFTVESALALLAGVTITIAGCGGDDGSSTPTSPSPAPGSSDVSGSVSANHGHAATIRSAQLMSGGAISLDIQNSADHPHTVQVSMAQMQSIAARQQVAITSSTNSGHQHTVTFN